jgi:hypothetical protein
MSDILTVFYKINEPLRPLNSECITSTIGSEKFQRILFWRNIFKSWPREKETTSPQIYSYMVKYLIKFVVNRRWEKLYLFLHLMLKNSWKSDKEWLQENVFSFSLGHDLKILRQNNILWNFSDPIVEVMHSEFSGRNGSLIL